MVTLKRSLLALALAALAADVCGGPYQPHRRAAFVAAPSSVPFSTDLIDWWDNRDADIAVTGALVDTWTGRTNGTVLTGTTTTRPTKTTVASVNYLTLDEGPFMDMPGGLTVDRQDSSIFVVQRRRHDSNIVSLWHMGTASTTHALYSQGEELKFWNATIHQATGIFPGDSIQTLFAIGNASNIIAGAGSEVNSTLDPSDSGTISDGYFGEWNGGAGNFPYNGDVLGVLVYGRAMDATDRAEVLDFCSDYYRATSRTNTKFFVVAGDSISFGTSTTDPWFYAWSAQLARSMTTEPKYYNGAVGGTALSANTAATQVNLELDQNSAITTRTALMCYGHNDINAGRSAIQLEGDIDTWITNVAAGDAGAVIVGCTILPSTDFDAGEEVIRVAVNTYIETVAAFDYTADPAADAALDDASDTAIYSDGTHLTDAGAAVYGGVVKTAMLANSGL